MEVYTVDMFTQSRNLCQSWDCTWGLHNLEILHWFLRSQKKFCCMHNWIQVVVWGSILYKGKELLQLCSHHQRWARTQAPRARDFCEVRQLTLPLSLGAGAERPQTCENAPDQGFTSETWRALNSLPLASSNALTPLVHYIRELCLRKRIVQSQDWLHILELGARFPNSEVVQCNLEIAQIARLRGRDINAEWLKCKRAPNSVVAGWNVCTIHHHNPSYHKCTLLQIIKFSLSLVKSSHQVRVISKWLLLCINRKESSLIPTLRSENLANISTECFSLLQGKSEEDWSIQSKP